jgi:hypothetical protein
MDLPSFLPQKKSRHDYHVDPPGLSVFKDQA